jgi:thiol:disulfide interchange protein DsbD
MVIAGLLMAPGIPGGQTAAAASEDHLQWLPYEVAAVEASLAGTGPVIIDFYADWCAPCRELDEKTFSAPAVRSVLEGYSRFKVDLTRSTESSQELTTRYRVMGVPTVVVFSGGEEIFRITGFEPPEQFLKRLEAVR